MDLVAGARLRRSSLLPVAAYGHCAFTAQDVFAAFDLMVLRSLE